MALKALLGIRLSAVGFTDLNSKNQRSVTLLLLSFLMHRYAENWFNIAR